MKNLLVVLALATIFAFAANAQSKDCCSKEKGETTKVEKSTNTDQTIKSDDNVKTITTTVTALTGEKETVQKEVKMTKMEMKEKCGDKSSCCSDMKMDKKVEKEVKKEIEKK